mmetsp:Transcript_35217/g.39978  ORF Transcript_35217/g.39978 Transcript_35217/m.39978 type:complete len:105 (-) Transcript_35217:62-376(-)
MNDIQNGRKPASRLNLISGLTIPHCTNVKKTSSRKKGKRTIEQQVTGRGKKRNQNDTPSDSTLSFKHSIGAFLLFLLSEFTGFETSDFKLTIEDRENFTGTDEG